MSVQLQRLALSALGKCRMPHHKAHLTSIQPPISMTRQHTHAWYCGRSIPKRYPPCLATCRTTTLHRAAALQDLIHPSSPLLPSPPPSPCPTGSLAVHGSFTASTPHNHPPRQHRQPGSDESSRGNKQSQPRNPIIPSPHAFDGPPPFGPPPPAPPAPPTPRDIAISAVISSAGTAGKFIPS